jgi:hypothetical protein
MYATYYAQRTTPGGLLIAEPTTDIRLSLTLPGRWLHGRLAR